MKKLLFVFAIVVGFSAHVARATNNCTGATYYDSDTDTCIACPTGYDYNTDAGKTDITQCQKHCDGGTYVIRPALDGYTQLEYIEATGTQWINTGISFGGTDTGTANMDIQFNNLTYVGVNAYFQMTKSGSCLTISGTPASCVSPYIRNNLIYTLNNGTSTLYAENNFIQTKNWGTSFATNPYYIFAMGGYKSTGRIYSLSLIKNGGLVRDMIPVRRDNDDAIGMYDRVTGTFFGNSGSGTFVASPDVINTNCVNVGTGYYAPASVVNFGSTGTRTACPIGTYSDVPNATTCQSCANATYGDETGLSACKSCPIGYDYNRDSGKTSVTQCQIHCNNGMYVPGYTQLEYIEITGTQYINTRIIPQNYNYSAEFTMSVSGFGKYFFGFGTGSWSGSGYQFGLAGSNGNSSWGGGVASTVASKMGVSANVFYNYKLTKFGFYVNDVLKSPISSPTDFVATGSLYIGRSNNSSAGNYNTGQSKWQSVKIYDGNNELVFDGVPARRNSDGAIGMFDRVTGTFFTNSGTGTFGAGPNATINLAGGNCENVGTGYYAPASTVNYGSVSSRTACPVGLHTVGYGHGADEANDCGRILHIGDYVVYMRRNKETTPALNIQMENGDMFYINLSPTNHNISRLHFEYGGNEYTAYDDSLSYGERNFDTGAQIVQ